MSEIQDEVAEILQAINDETAKCEFCESTKGYNIYTRGYCGKAYIDEDKENKTYKIIIDEAPDYEQPLYTYLVCMNCGKEVE